MIESPVDLGTRGIKNSIKGMNCKTPYTPDLFLVARVFVEPVTLFG